MHVPGFLSALSVSALVTIFCLCTSQQADAASFRLQACVSGLKGYPGCPALGADMQPLDPPIDDSAPGPSGGSLVCLSPVSLTPSYSAYATGDGVISTGASCGSGVTFSFSSPVVPGFTSIVRYAVTFSGDTPVRALRVVPQVGCGVTGTFSAADDASIAATMFTFDGAVESSLNFFLDEVGSPFRQVWEYSYGLSSFFDRAKTGTFGAGSAVTISSESPMQGNASEPLSLQFAGNRNGDPGFSMNCPMTIDFLG